MKRKISLIKGVVKFDQTTIVSDNWFRGVKKAKE